MRLVYICSPYAGDIERNTNNAKEYCREAIEENYVPIAPHLLYPQILDDTNPKEREAGIRMGIELLRVCDELWIFGDKISRGMEREIRQAEEWGMIIVQKELQGIHMQTMC